MIEVKHEEKVQIQVKRVEETREELVDKDTDWDASCDNGSLVKQGYEHLIQGDEEEIQEGFTDS